MKRNLKRIFATILPVMLIVTLFAGCSEKKEGIANLRTPDNGDQIAILHTSYGDITVEFFEDIAPKAVENFVTHSKDGYYDNIIFHRVIENFMIQSGDPEGTGTGGESIWGEPFGLELSDDAYNLRGALCMANKGADNTNGSQFYIVQAGVVSQTSFSIYESYGYSFTDQQKELYQQYGGAPWLDGAYTVFGQVIDGMDVVDAIAALEVDSASKPLEDVVLESVELTTYSQPE